MRYHRINDQSAMESIRREKRQECYANDDEESQEPGYEEAGTGVFVHEYDAFGYAIQQVSWNEDLQKEFVEWFYSGNWTKVPQDL